jgi:hypothetical protein
MLSTTRIVSRNVAAVGRLPGAVSLLGFPPSTEGLLHQLGRWLPPEVGTNYVNGCYYSYLGVQSSSGGEIIQTGTPVKESPVPQSEQ